MLKKLFETQIDFFICDKKVQKHLYDQKTTLFTPLIDNIITTPMFIDKQPKELKRCL